MKVFKKIFFWTYERNTWQWDVLCVLILAFVFLTPKSWFESKGLRGTRHATTNAVSTLLLPADAVGVETPRDDLERRVRSLTGRPDARVANVRRRLDSQGRLIGYEVDVR
jgi:hypothetical protein